MCKFIALVAVVLFVASSALAHPPVSVEKNPDGSGVAAACTAAVQETGGSMNCVAADGWIFCAIQEAEAYGGENMWCLSDNPDHVAVVLGMADTCGLDIAFNGNGICTYVMGRYGTHLNSD